MSEATREPPAVAEQEGPGPAAASQPAPGAPAGNYSALFMAGGLFMLAGAAAVRPIRGVR